MVYQQALARIDFVHAMTFDAYKHWPARTDKIFLYNHFLCGNKIPKRVRHNISNYFTAFSISVCTVNNHSG